MKRESAQHLPDAPWVLDSWSILAFYEDEPSGEAVEELILKSHEEGLSLLMSVINVAEVWYITARRISEAQADETIAEMSSVGIRFVDADWDLSKKAADFKSRYALSLGDCYAAALAHKFGARLVTGDGEFRPLDDEIAVHWL